MALRPLQILSIAACLILLAACSSGPKTFVNSDPGADFSRYATFGYPRQLGTDEQRGVTSLLSKYLMDAATRELEARGYQKSDNPDLLVNFSLMTKDKVRTTSTPTAGGFYGYRGYGAWGGYETQVTQYTEGTLTIDLADNRSNQLVWEGAAVGTLRDEARKNIQAAADSVVNLLFQQYPHYAPGFTPPPPASKP